MRPRRRCCRRPTSSDPTSTPSLRPRRGRAFHCRGSGWTGLPDSSPARDLHGAPPQRGSFLAPHRRGSPRRIVVRLDRIARLLTGSVCMSPSQRARSSPRIVGARLAGSSSGWTGLPDSSPARSSPDRRQAEFTHSSVPSAKNWCFHTGSRSLMVSTSSAQVSNAARRWSAATAATRAASPICSDPTR